MAQAEAASKPAELSPVAASRSSPTVRVAGVLPTVGLFYLQQIGALLERLHQQKTHPNRNLYFDHYISLLLLSYFNPVIHGLRQLQQLTDMQKVREHLGVKHASLGSLSEASQVFDPKALAGIFTQLAGQVTAADGLKRPPGVPEDIALIAVDGSLLEALARMVWAVWLEKYENAAKVHLHFDLSRGVPVYIDLTAGNGDEKASLRQHLAAACLYILDRGYVDYTLYQEIIAAKSSFVARLRCNAALETIKSRPLSAADRAAGVVSDEEVWLGDAKTGTQMPHPVRVIKVHVQNPPSRSLKPKLAKVNGKVKIIRTYDEEFDAWLVTDRMDLAAEIIALIYRYRWHVELFFRWFKCVLGFRHLFSESPNGVLLQVYAALIAGLLIVLWTGRKPNRYAFSLICFYLQGWATLEELLAGLERLKLKAAKR